LEVVTTHQTDITLSVLGGALPPPTIANALNDFCDVELVLVSIGLIGLVLRSSPKMLLMLFSAEF